MTRPRWTFLAALTCLMLPAAEVRAVTPVESAVAAKSFRDPRLHIPTVYLTRDQVRADAAARVAADIAALGLRADTAFYDARAGRLASLILSVPMIPGSGFANTLDWEAMGGRPASDAALQAAAWASVARYLAANDAVLRVDANELGPPRVGLFDQGALIEAFSPRVLGGIPVRDSGLTAVLNHGNLVLLGLQNWGDARDVTREAAIRLEEARLAVSSHVQPFFINGYGKGARLEYIPMVRGNGYEYRLAWVIPVTIAGDIGGWEGLVDAVSGELIAFEDRSQYAARKAVGGVYPVSNDQRPPDGIEEPGWPMPFANVTTSAGVITTNSAGAIGCVAGNVATALVGRYTRITDFCGPIDEVSPAGDLDLSFGPTPTAADCTVPPGHSAGDTKAARTSFHTLTRMHEQALGWLPNNAWLQAPLLANTNINFSCGLNWNGISINSSRQNATCANEGEVPNVMAHEWGHGLDNNDVNPTISVPGEAIADVHAVLRYDMSCVGRGFFRTQVCGGYGDGCIGTPATGCTGVREADFAQHRCNQPHTISWALSGFTSAQCGGTGPAPACPAGPGTPCGRETHCEGMIAIEAIWDLATRDLRAAPYNLDASTALEITTRLAFLGPQVLTQWNTCAVGGGCGATGGYLLFLAADDDDGNIPNGTPHMTAIRAAFQRHEIHCATPAAADSGCAGGPTTAPTVAAVVQDQGVTLSWSAVSGASRYYVYRAEGPNAASSGKIKIGETTGLTFLETNLQNGRAYSFHVLPVGSNLSCFGRMSTGTPVTPAPGANVAVRPGSTTAITGGDGDAFLDNCETATVGFTVENTGTGPLTNVRLVAVAFLTHPTSVLQTTLPAPISPSLADCASANGTFAFVLQGATNNQTTQIRVDVTADQLAGQVRSQILTIGGLETDAVAVATRTYNFDTSLSGWTVTSGTYTREAPGANATAFHLHSSALLNDQCDLVRSPVLGLKASSTLSLFNRYVTETPIPIPYDRANIGIIDLGSGTRTTIVPSGGRLYELPAGTPNGTCVVTDQAGWAGSQATFAQSTWASGALNPGGVFTAKRVQIEAAYASDSGLAEDGFRFDEVTVTNFEDLVPDVQTNTCLGVAVSPFALAVDAAGNNVMEPNELAVMAPTWRNIGGSPVTLTGATSSFTGPAGPIYANLDNAASYGTIGVAANGTCATGGNCYTVNAVAAIRPLTHWDATIVETVNPTATAKTWTLHIGNSFTDVPPSNSFYRFVETILHRNATGGCTSTTFCGIGPTSRDQMAVLVLRTFDASLNPPACVAGAETFADVPASSPFCRWIEELARRGAVGGCGNGNYCPNATVTRQQMAVFVLRTLDPTLNPPACATPVFADVPASSPFCPWIEELARRGVVSGCGNGNYCPAANVTREQMAVFLTVTFGLTLYGP
jgi:hypothetical protein